MHACDDIWEETNHIIVAHGHVGYDLLEGDLLRRVILVFLASAVQLLTQLGHLPLRKVSAMPRTICLRRARGTLSIESGSMHWETGSKFLVWATKGRRRDSSRKKGSKFLSKLLISLLVWHSAKHSQCRVKNGKVRK